MLYEKITADLKAAMKSKDTEQLEALRLLFSQIKNKAIDSGNRDEIPDDLVIDIVKKRVKQGKDSIEQYKNGGREDLASKEEKQLEYISRYMPEMMSESEIEKVALAKKDALNISDASKMGQLMGAVMAELKGKADGNDVKKVVQRILA